MGTKSRAKSPPTRVGGRCARMGLAASYRRGAEEQRVPLELNSSRPCQRVREGRMWPLLPGSQPGSSERTISGSMDHESEKPNTGPALFSLGPAWDVAPISHRANYLGYPSSSGIWVGLLFLRCSCSWMPLPPGWHALTSWRCIHRQ